MRLLKHSESGEIGTIRRPKRDTIPGMKLFQDSTEWPRYVLDLTVFVERGTHSAITMEKNLWVRRKGGHSSRGDSRVEVIVDSRLWI
jgi:hypothetical protein